MMHDVILTDGEYPNGIIVYTIKPDSNLGEKTFEELWVKKASYVNLSESERGLRGDGIIDFLKEIPYELNMQRETNWIYIFRFKKEADAALFKLRWA